MTVNYDRLCKTVSELNENVEVAIVLSGDKMAASHLKTGGPAPEDQDLQSMISQLQTVINATKVNEDKFGELEHIAIQYRYIHGLFFPINDRDTLVVGVVLPYDNDGLVKKIKSVLRGQKYQ